MPAIAGPQDGPVAVTGASGYIGSHVVKNLVEAGYSVRACVRDANRGDKTVYLNAINASGPGSIQYFSCDLMKASDGAYDEAFAGCSAVFHVAADIGTDPAYDRPSPQSMYDSLLAMTSGVLESCRRSDSVRRVMYTSSTAAVMGPGAPGRPKDYEYTEADWAGGTYESLDERYTHTNNKGEVVNGWSIERAAYAKGKVDAEKAGYEFGDRYGIDVVSCCPCHVMGPLLGLPHNTVWQRRIGLFLSGKSDFPPQGMNWNIVDVRDIATTQRLMATSNVARNGSRYMMVATDESGEPTMRELLATLAKLFPKINVAGDYVADESNTRLRAKCTKAIKELGLQTHDIQDTLRDTGNSLIELGAIEPAWKAK